MYMGFSRNNSNDISVVTINHGHMSYIVLYNTKKLLPSHEAQFIAIVSFSLINYQPLFKIDDLNRPSNKLL